MKWYRLLSIPSIALLVVFSFLLTLTWAGDNSFKSPIQVEGYVIDSSSGVGLSGVEVQIGLGIKDTNITGYFSIDVPSSGEVAVTVNLNGYKTFKYTITIKRDMESFIIEMEPLISEFDSSC